MILPILAYQNLGRPSWYYIQLSDVQVAHGVRHIVSTTDYAAILAFRGFLSSSHTEIPANLSCTL